MDEIRCKQGHDETQQLPILEVISVELLEALNDGLESELAVAVLLEDGLQPEFLAVLDRGIGHYI